MDTDELKVPPHSQSVQIRFVKGRPPNGQETEEIQRQWKLDKTLKLETLAADFYTLIDLQCDYPKEPKINEPLESLTTLLADQFSAYLDMVIGGELRHARNWTRSKYYNEHNDSLRYPSIEDMPISKIAKNILYRLEGHGGYAGRNVVWREWQGIRKELGLDALRATIGIFNLAWEAGYGGLSWKNATTILLDYLTGELSALAFVDTCFGLHHNNNIILDKVWRIKAELTKVLNYNLHNRMLDVAQYCSPEVIILTRRFRK